jgi:hypothetical protein
MFDKNPCRQPPKHSLALGVLLAARQFVFAPQRRTKRLDAENPEVAHACPFDGREDGLGLQDDGAEPADGDGALDRIGRANSPGSGPASAAPASQGVLGHDREIRSRDKNQDDREAQKRPVSRQAHVCQK